MNENTEWIMWERRCESCGWIDFTDEERGGTPISLRGGDDCQECDREIRAEWRVSDLPHPASLESF
jgi:hypothetical protein